MAEKNAVPLDRGWLILMTDLGIRPEDVLRRGELPADLFARENARIEVEAYFRLWQGLEAEAGDVVLPLRLGKSVSTEAFHPLIFAALCSPNLSVAVRRIAEYKRLVAPMHVIVEEETNQLFVGIEWDDLAGDPPASLDLTELVFQAQIARIGTREQVVPLHVESRHPIAHAEEYEAFFGVAPAHGTRHGITFSAADAQRPFLTASESMWQTFAPELQRRLTTLEAQAPLAERVRSQLLESLPSGDASIDVVARRLGLSARTLQRRLTNEGGSYKEIVRHTREQLARHYLTNTNLGYAEIAFLIGFEEPSSFFRAFREWTGSTPESVRLSHRPATAPVA